MASRTTTTSTSTNNNSNGVDWRWIVGISGVIIMILFSLTMGVVGYTFTNLANRVANVESDLVGVKTSQQPSIQQIERMVTLEQKVETLTREFQRLTAELQVQRVQAAATPGRDE